MTTAKKDIIKLTPFPTKKALTEALKKAQALYGEFVSVGVDYNLGIPHEVSVWAIGKINYKIYIWKNYNIEFSGYSSKSFDEAFTQLESKKARGFNQ